MARLLTGYQIAEIYTLEQIDAKIAAYQDALDGATMQSYRIDTTQGANSVTNSSPDQIMTMLSTWIKAREIKAGTYKGAQIYSANYTPGSR